MSAWPDICLTNDRAQCPGAWPFLTADQLCQCVRETTLKDACGAPLDLTVYGDIWLLARAQYGQGPLYLNKQCEKLAEPGRIRVSLSPNDLHLPGVFLAEFDLQSPTETVPVALIRAYLEVVESLQHQDGRPRGLSLAEVRMVIMDRCTNDNFLLDAVEFDDQQISWAIRRPVDLWNETPPPLDCYNTSNFPYHYHWCNAAAGELMRMAARNYARNTLKYSASNLQVADKEKVAEYEQLGKGLLEEYKSWLLLEKRRINCLLAMGNTSIPAYGPQRYYLR